MPKSATQETPPQTQVDLLATVLHSLEESKALDICSLDVRGITTIADTIIVCSGSVNRHVKAIANHLLTNVKQQGFSVHGSEGSQRAEWILVDLSDVIVHIMVPETREFYRLEQLWSVDSDSVDSDSV